MEPPVVCYDKKANNMPEGKKSGFHDRITDG